MAFKIKIDEDKITYGPKTLGPLDELTSTVLAHDLVQKGYICISNAYCLVARIDRDDWLDVLAKQMNTCRADYYNVDGSGINTSWVGYYVRVHSKDVLTINPSIYQKMKLC